MFVLYKLFSREISFWRSTARDRRAAGHSCCQCCATLGHDDICLECMDVLEDGNRYTWMKDCLLDSSTLGRRLRSPQNHEFSLRHFIWRGPLDSPTNDDEDWAWNLDFYTPLETLFKNIVQLAAQWMTYHKYRRRNLVY
ncbi:unnamed protein product [Clonostachys rosea]|uniref:Uncharacterized protein n=1 Tax=Bionectria ochroleuca TaxID=29856 RepID=A0ABY6U0Q9_BIOOC|nr:unnamed protein product [Clonostachys rosea]